MITNCPRCQTFHEEGASNYFCTHNRSVDAQSRQPVDLFAALTKTELRELSTRMLTGAVKAGKLAGYCHSDYRLWTAAVRVMDDCFEINQDCFSLEFPGR